MLDFQKNQQFGCDGWVLGRLQQNCKKIRVLPLMATGFSAGLNADPCSGHKKRGAVPLEYKVMG
jgi:hypothetical protein